MIRHRTLLCGALTAATLGGFAHAADVGGRPLYATLTGEAEITPEGDPNGGGTAKLTVNPGKNQVCWILSVNDIATATAAHIHTGNASSEGGVVLGLTAPTGGSSSGCATVSADLVKGLLKTPAEYYVNVHNADFPDGAIRGQLSSKKPK